MSRPAYYRSVIRPDNYRAGLVIYHLEAFVIEHIEKRIIFSCSNEGEYSGYNPAHTCHVTGVSYSRSDSAVPYTVTVYSAYFIRSTARISFTVGNPGNLGCVLCRTETAVEFGRAAHGFDCLADIPLWLSGLTASAIRRLRSQTHSLFVNCFVALSLSTESRRQHFLGLLSFTLNSSFVTENIF